MVVDQKGRAEMERKQTKPTQTGNIGTSFKRGTGKPREIGRKKKQINTSKEKEKKQGAKNIAKIVCDDHARDKATEISSLQLFQPAFHLVLSWL